MVTIILAANKESEEELKTMGFKKEEVWVNYNLADGSTDAERKASGDRKVFAMRHRPFMFCTTSWWGMGVD